MSTNPILPLLLATDHYNISKEQFVAKINKVWAPDTLFYNAALKHYDQIQYDMKQYEELLANGNTVQ